jgi:hypothetical protein
MVKKHRKRTTGYLESIMWQHDVLAHPSGLEAWKYAGKPRQRWQNLVKLKA